jgi:AcrR family transcriptional regulator
MTSWSFIGPAMGSPEPKWRRRKAARPAEIVAAALAVFAENGFAAAKLSDIAARAGIAKSSVYLYFETKEDLFRAVVRTAIAPNLAAVEAAAETLDAPFAELAPMLLSRAAATMADDRVPALAKMVIGESRNFPDLARIWHDDVVAKVIDAVSQLIARGQARGEIRPGDPRLHAFSLLGPMVMAMLFRDVFAGVSQHPPDLARLAAQHARMALEGILTRSTEKST